MPIIRCFRILQVLVALMLFSVETLSRAASAPSIVGAWLIENAGQSQGDAVITVLPNGNYFLATDGDAVADPSGQDGMERGTYTWNPPDGIFSAIALVDTSGDLGLSNAGITNVTIVRDTLMTALGLFGSNTLTRIAASPAFTVGADNFDDNVEDTDKWGADLGGAPFGAHTGTLTETGARLEYTSAFASGHTVIGRPWIGNRFSYGTNWEVQVDVNVGAVPLTAPNQEAGLGLIIFNAVDPVGGRFDMNLDVFRGSSSVSRRFVTHGYANSNLFNRVTSNTVSQSAAVRITFDAAGKVLSAWYDTDGPVNGYNWVLLNTMDLHATGSSWAMSDASYFVVAAGAYSDNFIVTPAHLIFADNFSSANALPPLLSITLSPRSLSAVAGRDAEFSVEVSNPLPLRYQWAFNGVDVLDATNDTLVIRSAAVGDAGDYQVRVSNSFDSILSGVAKLRVIIPPVVSQEPADASVPLGSLLTFCVEATGSAPFQYQWRLNGVNIPGATDRCYTIPKVRIEDGGQYSVIVSSEAGSVLSRSARLAITQLPTAPLAKDDFASRLELSGASGIVSGNNIGATKEPNEPDHAGKPGGGSVWYTWTAPAKGIATFRTSGSAFDTLLAVYTGVSVANLVAKSSDEDGGGYLASAARFNAQEGVSYQVAIDGYAGGQGDFILSWAFEITTDPLPEITGQPQSQTVPRGTEVVLAVEASGQNLVYQWIFNGASLDGATGLKLVLSNVQPRQVGTYSLRVTNPQLRGVESLSAVVEIGLPPAVQSQDKLEDLFLGNGQLLPNAVLKASANLAGGISVHAGTIGSHTLNNSISTNSGPAEINTLCGLIGGARRWLDLRAEEPGILTVDTEGSEIDTLLAVFTQQTFASSRLTPVACEDDVLPHGKRSRVRFAAVPGTDYLIGIDGKGGQTGVIQLNWSLGVPVTVLHRSSLIYVSWPASFNGFVLEEALATFAPAPQWSVVGTAPSLVKGTNVVSLPVSGKLNKLYRLRQP